MQSGLDRLVAGARRAGIYRRCGRLCVLLLGLMVSACANIGQIGNLGIGNLLNSGDSPQQMSVAVESIDGPPPAVHEKFLRALKDEAGGTPDHRRDLGRSRLPPARLPGVARRERRDVDHLGLGRLRCRAAPGLPAQGRGQGRRGRGRLGHRRRSGAAAHRAQRPRPTGRLGLVAPQAVVRRRRAGAGHGRNREKEQFNVRLARRLGTRDCGHLPHYPRRGSPCRVGCALADQAQAAAVPLPRGRPAPEDRPARALAFAAEGRDVRSRHCGSL